MKCLTGGAAKAAGVALAALVLGGCAMKLAPVEPDTLVLFGNGQAAGLRVQLAAPGGQMDLTGASVSTPNTAKAGEPPSDANLRRTPRRADADALEMRWQNTWFSSLRLVADRPMDLRQWLPDSTLEVDVNVLDVAKSGLSFAMGCGTDCASKVQYVLPSRALQGLGWQRLSFALTCFERDGNDFSAVTQPFVVDTHGSGAVIVSNVRIVRGGKPSAACPDYRTESVTPAPLLQAWAVDWWMRRHEDKLLELRALKAAGTPPSMVFIGDSITHGWENVGRPVWDQAFGKYHPLNLGYGGDRTENVLWRLQNGEVDGIAPKVAVLMIGTNNTGDRQEDPNTTAAGIRRIVEELRKRQPGTKVLVLAIFPRDEQPNTLLRRLNNRVNERIAGLHDGRHVFFLDINASLMNADGTISRDVMPDLLHLSEKGYRQWARAIVPTLERLLSLP
jgi:lysophospholipase L1-like esterase